MRRENVLMIVLMIFLVVSSYGGCSSGRRTVKHRIFVEDDRVQVVIDSLQKRIEVCSELIRDYRKLVEKELKEGDNK